MIPFAVKTEIPDGTFAKAVGQSWAKPVKRSIILNKRLKLKLNVKSRIFKKKRKRSLKAKRKQWPSSLTSWIRKTFKPNKRTSILWIKSIEFKRNLIDH